jgi:ElaB/YqjD/DUF883 family membrane-anchored ribosome-binding protein
MATSMPNQTFPETSSHGEPGSDSTFPKSGAAPSAAGTRSAPMSPSSASPATPSSGGSGSRPADAATDAIDAAADRDMLRRVVQGAHEAVDRIADKAIPAVERLRERVDETSDKLRDRAAQAGELKDEWAESLRTTIRERPLTALLTAVAVGVLLSRLTSSDR